MCHFTQTANEKLSRKTQIILVKHYYNFYPNFKNFVYLYQILTTNFDKDQQET